MMLREAVFWRLSDLMSQSYLLHQQQNGLGARILLRSGLETVSTLIYLNQITQLVLDEKLNFHEFSDKTRTRLLGSRNKLTNYNSLNIITVLEKCDARYPGLKSHYANLSESAHPSYEGLCMGYSKFDRGEYEANFSNRWMQLYGEHHLRTMELCMEIFHLEYDLVWTDLIVKLEGWIETNDSNLEKTKTEASES